jgi:hypothetical protein
MRLGVSQGQIVREQLEKARAAQGGRRFTPREAPTGARVRRLGFLAGKIETRLPR